MRALLFNPWITDYAAFDHWVRPLNLLRLSTLLKRRGWMVDLYDCLDRLSPDLTGLPIHRHRLNHLGAGHYFQEVIPTPDVLKFIPRYYRRYGIPADRVEGSLRKLPVPDVVIIPCMMTYWYLGAYEAIALMRRLFPEAVVILGGIYAQLCREHAEQHSGADAVVTGKDWFDIVNQIGRIVGDGELDIPGDQSTWIEPDYDLIRQHTCFPVLTSTGCPCHCTYCATHSIWYRYHRYPVEAVADSIERVVQDYGATDVVFYDDALLTKRDQHFIPLMQEVLRRDIQVRYHTPNAVHVRQMNRETAYLMKRSGFTTIRLGLETVERKWQKQTGGKVYTHEYENAMRYLREAGFTPSEVGTYIILGMPGQSLESVWDACQVVYDNGSEVKIAMYSPLPHTELFTSRNDSFCFDVTREPLLQNNSITPWRSLIFSTAEYQKLKSYVVANNQKVRNMGVLKGE